MNLTQLKKQLAKAAAEPSPERRGVFVANVISKALQPLGEHPVLVGGSAVAFYTSAQYTTNDIDMIAVGGPKVSTRMLELGFRRCGKDYVHDELALYVEFPSSSLGPGERWITLDLGKDQLRIISIEDLIVDRLNHYKYFQSTIDALNVMMLLELPNLDMGEIEKKAQIEDTLDALDYINRVQKKIIRKKLNKEEANNLLKRYF